MKKKPIDPRNPLNLDEKWLRYPSAATAAQPSKPKTRTFSDFTPSELAKMPPEEVRRLLREEGQGT